MTSQMHQPSTPLSLALHVVVVHKEEEEQRQESVVLGLLEGLEQPKEQVVMEEQEVMTDVAPQPHTVKHSSHALPYLRT